MYNVKKALLCDALLTRFLCILFFLVLYLVQYSHVSLVNFEFA